MKWLEKIKRQRLDRHPYDKEEQRLQMLINQIDPFDERYDQLQAKLKNNNSMRDVSKESRRKICKTDRGGIIAKVVGVVGALVGGFMIGKFERDGMIVTGEKRSYFDAISRTLGNLFTRG